MWKEIASYEKKKKKIVFTSGGVFFYWFGFYQPEGLFYRKFIENLSKEAFFEYARHKEAPSFTFVVYEVECLTVYYSTPTLVFME